MALVPAARGVTNPDAGVDAPRRMDIT